ncbi:MAG: hypothetical protein A3I89_03295 [Candidatus Harrisonbacteria bacterium RIFCSPLOWO2_02_FULL_41_11]|uniref:HTH arsR-type domain-containing protein n=1 Tax=Candidatus Harrisonbacteria bacterium RIFCSPHIGHO2_02_FULL_42_16 TaxID=1798404 RepID=A0A1G1ZIS2_9BACT|nr:MAG: hypothetical protein A3B92_02785 [Candidatus Harrisonbacteria bacterium RIFCSPHIGHO2_02_FULL_42_16]OGY66263.1 MAG: hypothetical protein A3I89_03295 [Candidatus Harrisonbacteria bacterium RIFCSPLOWO2_02_FULL_41_11]
MHIKELEKLFKTLGNKRRLRIIKLLLNDGEITVSDVASIIKLSLKATSKHLLNLFNAEIVEKEQRSKNVYYKIPKHLNQPIKDLISHIHHSHE